MINMATVWEAVRAECGLAFRESGQGERSSRANYAELLGGNRPVLSDDFIRVAKPSSISLIDFSRRSPKKKMNFLQMWPVV